MRNRTVKKWAAAAAICCLLIGTGVYAAGRIASIASHGSSEPSVTEYDNIDKLEAEDDYFKCRVLKEGKYKDIVLLEEYNELEGETFKVGVLSDGVVATPIAYNFDCFWLDNQNEGVIVDDSEESLSLSYNKSMATPTGEGDESYRIDLKKLSDEQIAKIVDTVTKRKPEYVEYIYHFPAQGLQTFIYMVK